MTITKLRDGFEMLLEFITIAVVITLATVVVIGVTFRVAGNSLSWYDEVASVLLAWVTYYGAALAAIKRGHISVPGLVRAQPPRVRVCLVVISEICVIGFFVVLAIYGFHVLRIIGDSTLVSVPIPVSVTQSAIPIGAALYVIAEVLNLPLIVREALEGHAPPDESDTVETTR